MNTSTIRRFALMLLAGLSVVSCKGGGNPVAPPPPPVRMTQAEAETFATSVTRAISSAMNACYNRMPNPNGVGTFPLNFSCDATRTCQGGGTIRPSLTATGQIQVTLANTVINSPLSGSLNILDWACTSGAYIISGNPTVSLSGAIQATAIPAFAVFTMNQTGQIIVGNTPCSLSLFTSSDTSNPPAHVRGSICDRSVDLIVP
jgi:hypothetical protein